MKEKNFEIIEQWLKKNKPHAACDTSHEHMLRRALLNSPYFSTSFLIRWKKRLGVEHFSVTQASSALLGGILLSFIFQFASLGISKSALSENVSVDANPKTVLQTLYDQGRIQYVGEERDGSRIYMIETDVHSHVEIRDRSPYHIEVVASR